MMRKYHVRFGGGSAEKCPPRVTRRRPTQPNATYAGRGAARTILVLPDGRVLILLRGLAPGAWPPFKSKVVIADPADIRPGEAWPWREVADLSGLVPPENYEGLAVAQGPSGLELWLIADANRSVVMQRTLLVKLVWNEPAGAGRAR